MAKTSTVSVSPANILVMDDDESILEISQAVLSRAGHTVTLTTHGNAAVDLYQEAFAGSNPFDLVIVDLTIPGAMGGRQTLQELLKIDPRVKVILSSGYATDPAVIEPQKFGFKGALAKPFLWSDLLRMIGMTIAPPPPISSNKSTVLQSQLTEYIQPFGFLAAASTQVYV